MPNLFVPTGLPIITSVTSTTPTIVGFGTVSANVQYSWRVNDILYVRGIFTTGTPTATEARINVYWRGDAVTVDSSKFPAGARAGDYSIGANTGSYYTIIYPSSNVTYVNMGVGSAGSNSLVVQNGNVLSGGSGQAIAYTFDVPILGW